MIVWWQWRRTCKSVWLELRSDLVVTFFQQIPTACTGNLMKGYLLEWATSFRFQWLAPRTHAGHRDLLRAVSRAGSVHFRIFFTDSDVKTLDFHHKEALKVWVFGGFLAKVDPPKTRGNTKKHISFDKNNLFRGHLTPNTLRKHVLLAKAISFEATRPTQTSRKHILVEKTNYFEATRLTKTSGNHILLTKTNYFKLARPTETPRKHILLAKTTYFTSPNPLKPIENTHF